MASDSGHEDTSAKAAQSPRRGHKQEEQTSEPSSKHTSEAPSNPPLPQEELPQLPNEAPPLPDEAPPGKEADDGWEPVWDETTQAYYFFNRTTGVTQWENPRIPEATEPVAKKINPSNTVSGGYNPAIHGDYDPSASYAVEAREAEAAAQAAVAAPAVAEPDYSASGYFNKWTGKWERDAAKSENYSDEAKSKRQLSAFYDVDKAANSHGGVSLRAERAQKQLSKAEVKAFKQKRKEKKEEKRRAWLRD